jgi:hypothetical protein
VSPSVFTYEAALATADAISVARGKGFPMPLRFAHRTSSRRLSVGSTVFVTVAAVLVLAAQSAFALTPVPVFADPDINEAQPSATANAVVYTHNSVEHPHHFNTYVNTPGGGETRINEAGTQSFQASIDGTTVLYSRFGPQGADLRLYDVATGERSDPPKGVNRPGSEEFGPNIDGRYYAFIRADFEAPEPYVRLVLFDTRTGRSRVLADVNPRREYLDSDQVNGDWVVWEYCRFSHHRFTECDVYRYRISTERAVVLPNPGKQQYTPSVTADGTVYYGRSGNGTYWKCGLNAHLVRQPLHGPAVVIASLPQGSDMFSTFALEGEYGLASVYFEQAPCEGNFGADIYRVDDARGS